MSHPILIVDSYNLFTRHFIANPTMNKQGQQIGGFVGFLRNLKHLSEKLLPSKVIVVWEGGGSPRRRAIFPEYKSKSKAQRLNRFYEDDIPDTVGNRDYQVRLIIEALKHVPVQQIYIADCEADDVIGYLCRYKFKDSNIVVVSSDKDFYQLIDDRVSQWSPGQKKFITADTVFEKFDLWPVNMCIARSFIGDQSDGIDGVKGAGFKTMTKRFPVLQSSKSIILDEILNEAKSHYENSNVQIYKNIVDSEAIVLRNWKLMHLDIENLSGDQIKKLEDSISGFVPKKNKMNLMRLMAREGIQDFDIDSFFMSLNASID